MYERFTDRARKAMQLANKEAMKFNFECITPEHILLGIAKAGGVGTAVLEKLGTNYRDLDERIRSVVEPGPEILTIGNLLKTPKAKRVVELAMETARNTKCSWLGSEHLLMGIMLQGDSEAYNVLRSLEITVESVAQAIDGVVAKYAFPDDPPANITVQVTSREDNCESEYILHHRYYDGSSSGVLPYIFSEAEKALVEAVLEAVGCEKVIEFVQVANRK